MNTLSHSQAFTLPSSVGSRSSINLLDRLRSFVTRKPPTNPIEDFVNDNGGALTDQLEREISRRFGSHAG
jgi:hypothetical protein